MPSKITTMLATFLFVAQAPIDEFAVNPARTRELIQETADRLGPDAVALAVAESAYWYGQNPETSAPYMRTCLHAVELANVQAPVPGQRTAVTR
ncbi:hypothetical protein ACIBEA_40350 [Streptomyces sp. NPDC051555]|uniref:hypothetical protein n=1 Tax=Streptomyces sp. NPDC051555 TaxID=3365657 RepID=UPI0037B3C82A